MSRSIEPRMRGARLVLSLSICVGACVDAPLDGPPTSPEAERATARATATANQLDDALAHAELSLRECEDLENQCFGAVGSRCGGTPRSWPVEVPPFVQLGCQGNRCWTNAGSWEHDECCAVHPRGHWCGSVATLLNIECKTAWDRAVHRVSHGLSWRREVDACRVDRDGRVDFEEYCAPKGVIVATDDDASCCSRRARPLNIFFDFARLARQGVLVDDSFRPVVCL